MRMGRKVRLRRENMKRKIDRAAEAKVDLPETGGLSEDVVRVDVRAASDFVVAHHGRRECFKSSLLASFPFLVA
jgi:hypothetical protein